MLFKEERDFWNELETVPIGNSDYLGPLHGVDSKRRQGILASARKSPLILDYGSGYTRAVNFFKMAGEDTEKSSK
jgi:hypothetical protein